jgi:hypothetical protein
VSVGSIAGALSLPVFAFALDESWPELADGPEPLRDDVVVVDRLQVDLPRVREVAVGETGVELEHARERVPDRVLDEARLQVRVLDDEELVRTLQQRVDRRAHRPLHDVRELLRVHGLTRADVEGAAPALVVRRERDELEDPLDVRVVEPRLEQPLRRAAAHEPLRARARVDSGRLDADDASRAALARRRDPDQRDHLLRGELGHRRSALARVARDDAYLGAPGALPPDDVLRDVLGELLDEERLADHDLVDRLLEQLRKARHVDALLRGVEVDRAVDRRGDQLLGRAPAQANRLANAGDAGARETQLHVGQRGLEVLCEKVLDVHGRF